MNTMVDWKNIQSVGRGIRPNKELFAEDFLIDWTHVLQPHWVEFTSEKGDKKWRSYTKKPPLSHIYMANCVVRKNEDGTFEYIKNRAAPLGRLFSEQEEKEFLFVILKAEAMYR